MSGHTKGPWRVSELCAGMIDIRHSNMEPGAISLTLAKVAARLTWQQEGEANARLIAAAPEFLEALRLYAYPGNFEGRPSNDELRAIARAAIAKATGAQP